MKKLALTLAALTLTAVPALAWDSSDLHGRYVLHETGRNNIDASTAAIGIVNADGHGGFTGWEYSYAYPMLASGFPQDLLCHFGIRGIYNISADGHLSAHVTYSGWSNPPVCGTGLKGTWDGAVTINRNLVEFAEHGGGIASGSLTK